MPWVAVGLAVGSTLIQNNASRAARNAQERASEQSDATQRYQYDTARADNAPLLGARNASLARLQSLLGIDGQGGGIDPNKVMQDPGYQFGMSQGQNAISNQMAARGMRNSGAAAMAAGRYANDYATTKYDQALNRQLNPLQSLAGLGQSGVNQITASGQNMANNISYSQSALGNAQAANALAQGNQWAGLANQLGGWYSNQYGNRSATDGTAPGGSFGVMASNGN